MSNFPSPLLSRFRISKKTVRVMVMVIAALDKWRVYLKISSSLETSGEYKVILTPTALEEAERYLIASAQEKLELKELESLLPKTTQVRGVGGGRSKVRYRIGYDADSVPVLPAKQRGINSVVMRSRSKVWVMKGARMAEQVIADCYQCRLCRKVVLNQVMASLPQERVGPVPIFDAVAIDLFAPLELKDMVRKEVSGKEWGIIFVCIATLAIYIVLLNYISLIPSCRQ